jgi:hypothetical protein
VACPFFMPIERLAEGPWTHSPRVSLGDAYRGVCTASPMEPFIEPPEAAQRDLCNCGYARGRCDRFPGGEAVDAVRFSVISHADGRVRMIYVMEKNHAPHGHGVLEFPDGDLPSAETQILTRQACAFVESYLRRLVS